jgi:hypothetical protein
MTDAPTPKPGILDIAPYVGGKSRIEGIATPMKLSSNENALGAGEKARAAYEAAIANIHMYPDGRASKLRDAVADHHGLEARSADLRQRLGRGLRPAEPDLSDARRQHRQRASTASSPTASAPWPTRPRSSWRPSPTSA